MIEDDPTRPFVRPQGGGFPGEQPPGGYPQAGAQPAGPAPAAPRPAPVAPRLTPVLVAVAVAIVVSVGIGVYGRLHEATFFAFNIAGFSSGAAAKAWLATIVFVLAVVQLASAFTMYRASVVPNWVGPLHKWSGRAAVIVSVPVAVHCLYALGFDPGEPRTLIHSLFGCFFYGAFVAKMLLLTRKGVPSWGLPVLGGAVFTALTALWLTSSVWFFATKGIIF